MRVFPVSIILREYIEMYGHYLLTSIQYRADADAAGRPGGRVTVHPNMAIASERLRAADVAGEIEWT